MNSSDYSMEDRMMEYEETHLDLLLKIDELKATSMRENKNNLELMKALECKKHLNNLKEDCAAEIYIDSGPCHRKVYQECCEENVTKFESETPSS